MSASRDPSYVVISPVKDEASYVEHTLRSVVSQTKRPVSWVIVDDGSQDATPEIVRSYADEHPFITLVSHPGAGSRAAGSPVIRAFDYGLTKLGDVPYDFITKLDCDLSFGPDYFERILDQFEGQPRLGIASGIYLEQREDGEWRPIAMPPYHAFGASKVVRRQCFEEIGGFASAAGWDTADEIKAIERGWRTGHFTDLEVKHHKREGSGVGQLRTNRMHGEIFYATGGDPLFFALKALHRVPQKPYLAGAVALTAGYTGAAIRRAPRLVTEDEARTYRRILRSRMFRRSQDSPVLTPLGIGR